MPAGATGWRPPDHPEVARALGLLRSRLPGPRADPHAVVVACSGGPDSVALLGLVALLRSSERLRVTVAHVDHGLREASGAEAELVTCLAERIGLDIDTVALALDPGAGLPARARRARQDALVSIAARRGAGWVALGHTQTDQAETVLLALTRGAGLSGLSGMPTLRPWSDAVAWWRPLLDLSRPETAALCRHLELPFVDDPTNACRDAPRTLIRHEVLPRLAAINPAVERAVARAAEHARRADVALAEWTGNEMDSRLSTPSETVPAGAYRISDAARLPDAVRRRLIREACRRAGLAADAVGADIVDRVDAAIREGASAPRRWDLHPSRRLVVASGHLWVE